MIAAAVAELVYATDLKSVPREGMGVQLSPAAKELMGL